MKLTAALTALLASAYVAYGADSYACFQATFNSAEKTTAVKALSVLLSSYGSVIPNGGISYQFGESAPAVRCPARCAGTERRAANNAIAYVCNFSGANITALANQTISYDSALNSKCGNSTSGRVRLDCMSASAAIREVTY